MLTVSKNGGALSAVIMCQLLSSTEQKRHNSVEQKPVSEVLFLKDSIVLTLMAIFLYSNQYALKNVGKIFTCIRL